MEISKETKLLGGTERRSEMSKESNKKLTNYLSKKTSLSIKWQKETNQKNSQNPEIKNLLLKLMMKKKIKTSWRVKKK
jgi:hypothetical protein